jgi:hypothetical protein
MQMMPKKYVKLVYIGDFYDSIDYIGDGSRMSEVCNEIGEDAII